ncbi:hypothetical protein N8Z63_06905 [Octadecabacter sp.]|nr:hypothetical protein [Octadecabacter sp.]
MRSHRLLEQLDEARGLFQSANVHEQHEIEAIRTELRLRGLFSSKQIRPSSMAYESIVAVLLMQMTRTGEKLTVPPTVQSNPHKYATPTALPRDLVASVKADLLLLEDSTYSPALRLHQLVIDTLARVNGTKEDA